MTRYVDGVEIAKELVGNEIGYTWLLCIDGIARRVHTYDYKYQCEIWMVSV